MTLQDQPKLRIGLVHLGKRGSGGPISLELASGLTEQAEVFALLSEQCDCLDAWEESGVPFETVPTYRTTAQALSSYLYSARFSRIASRIQQRQPDVLLFPMFYTWNPFIQSKLGGIPSVIAVHDPVPHPGLQDFAFRILENRSIRMAERCIVFSRAFEAELVSRGASPGRVDCVPLGMLSYYERWGAGNGTEMPSGSTSPADTVLFLGRITPYKGLDVLLKAYRQVALQRKAQERPVKLIIAGEGDLRPYRRLLEGLPDVEIANRWLGDEEVGSYFKRAGVVVLPYTSASQSGVITVAARYGTAVLATRTGGIPEQIRSEETGLLAAPGSVDELASALMRLLGDPGLQLRLGENLRRDYQENRTWSKIASLVYNSCRKAAAARQG